MHAIESSPSVASKLVSFLTLMRPFTWLWFTILPMSVGYLLLDPEPVQYWRYLAFVAAVVLADSAATTLNDVFDADTDGLSIESDRRHRPIVAGEISPREAIAFACLLMGSGLGLAFLAGRNTVIGLAAALVLALAYSVPPLRLNARPWASQPFWLVLFSVGVATIGMMARSFFTIEALVYCLSVGAFMGVGETLAKDIRDWDNDAKAGKRTSVVVLGPGRAALLSRGAAFVGTTAFMGFLWLVADVALWARLLCTGLLLFWAGRVFELTHRLHKGYDKAAGAALHKGYIRVYLAVNVALLGGMVDRAQDAFF